MSNERGYAYKALAGAYDRSMTWNWAAALAKDGKMPSKYDYVSNGLDLFDRSLVTGMDEAKATVDGIITSMNSSLTELLKGKFSYPEADGVRRGIITRYDTILDVRVSEDDAEHQTIGTSIPEIEVGYAAVDDADEMRVRLRTIAARLSDEDMATLASYINGEYETITDACGGKREAQYFTQRVRRQCKGLQLNGAF